MTDAVLKLENERRTVGTHRMRRHGDSDGPNIVCQVQRGDGAESVQFYFGNIVSYRGVHTDRNEVLAVLDVVGKEPVEVETTHAQFLDDMAAIAKWRRMNQIARRGLTLSLDMPISALAKDAT